MAGHIRTREFLDGKLLPTDKAKRTALERELSAKAKAAGRPLGKRQKTYQARHPGPRGKTVTRTFQRKRDAERWLQAQGTAMQDGTWLDPALGKRTFVALAQQWTVTRAVHHSPRTRERNASILRTYLLPAFAQTPLARLDRPAIKHWFSTHPFPSPATAKKVHTVLSSSILSEGVELGWLRTNPAARLRLPTQPRDPRGMSVLTAQEVRQLATAAEQHTDRAQDGLAIVMAAYTGLRAGELWALCKEDLVLKPTDEARVLVRRTLTTEDGALTFRLTTKTDKPRTVSLPAFLARQLATHTRQLRGTDLVFSSPGGGGGRKAGERTPIRHELWMRRVFKPAKAALPADKQHLRFHDLRHTCASLLIANGASIMLVSKRLGHASTRMTLDRYSWMYPSEEAAMAVALDAVWNAQPAPLDAKRGNRMAR